MKATQSCLTLWDPMGYPCQNFSRPEYWSKCFPSPGCLLNSGIKHRSSALQVDSLPAEPQGKCRTGEDLSNYETQSLYRAGSTTAHLPFWKWRPYLFLWKVSKISLGGRKKMASWDLLFWTMIMPPGVKIESRVEKL